MFSNITESHYKGWSNCCDIKNDLASKCVGNNLLSESENPRFYFSAYGSQGLRQLDLQRPLVCSAAPPQRLTVLMDVLRIVCISTLGPSGYYTYRPA